MKQHLAGKKGDATSCKSVPHDVRYRLEENLKEIDQKRPAKKLRKEEDNPLEVDDEIVQEIIPSSSSQLAKKKASTAGDKFFAPRTSSGAQLGIRSAFAGKEALHRADLAVVRWLYDCCIPMNAVNSIYYQPMIDAISAIGPGYKGPTYHADQRNRQLINFLVYCPRGMVFIKSVDASDIVKNAQNLCNLFMDMVAFAGADNVVHLVTDNAANYKAAGRKREGWIEIIQPGATRFATTFIALKSIYEHKHDIQALITSKTFVESRYYKDSKVKDVTMIVLDNQFWNFVEIVKPLVRLLRIVDSDDRPSLGYVYDSMYRAKRAIKNTFSCPNVKDLTVKILGQTASSSGCERNWSVFERIHSKKRNKLEHERLNDLVYIHYNFRLRNRVANKKKALDPIDYESIDQIDYWVMEEDDSQNTRTEQHTEKCRNREHVTVKQSIKLTVELGKKRIMNPAPTTKSHSGSNPTDDRNRAATELNEDSQKQTENDNKDREHRKKQTRETLASTAPATTVNNKEDESVISETRKGQRDLNRKPSVAWHTFFHSTNTPYCYNYP
ncbi:uncharacterized protein LOC129310731 [Prosopis cineraria]|uniref:uncharacterized protein LOC129310731 n=1 Tax=Prosopis cineraria TaxID=364024 RepID=UPI0024100A8C|nr:uncharacterized protein LOC129310731 [Prosopis cineraria]